MWTVCQGFAKLLFVVAGALFLIGGRAIAEFGGVDRLTAEAIGIGLTIVFGAAGFVVLRIAENFE